MNRHSLRLYARKSTKQRRAITRAIRFDDPLHLVPYPRTASEFEVQAFLIHRLREMGHNVRGEVSSKCGRFRFDLVVFVNFSPVRILEVKRRRRFRSHLVASLNEMNIRTQMDAYSQLGIPVDRINGVSGAREFIAYIQKNPEHLWTPIPRPETGTFRHHR